VHNRSAPAILDGEPNDALFEFRKLGTWSPVSLDLQGEFWTICILHPRVQGSKTVTLTPGLNGEPFKVTVFDDFSSILDFDQILCWESSLDRNQTYTIEIRASGSSGAGYMVIHTLDIIDGGPNPSAIGPSEEPNQLSAGPKAGITAGAVLVVILLAWPCVGFGVVECIHQALAEASNITVFVGTKSDYPQRTSPKYNPVHELESVDPSPSPSPGSNSNQNPPHATASVTRRAFRHLYRLHQSFAPPAPIREIDAGPATLPPEYDHSWAANASVSTSALASTRRTLPRPPGLAPPSTKAERNDSEQTADPRSSQSRACTVTVTLLRSWPGQAQAQGQKLPLAQVSPPPVLNLQPATSFPESANDSRNTKHVIRNRDTSPSSARRAR
ncbi:hypothetical protein WG66_013377, partial [Moniliophthora roreri]